MKDIFEIKINISSSQTIIFSNQLNNLKNKDLVGFSIYKPIDIFQFSKTILEKQKKFIHPSAQIDEGVDILGNVYLDEGVKIYKGSKLEGNIYIGKNSKIYNNVLIRGNSSVGENSAISFCSDIKNVIAGYNFLVGPHCSIPDSIFGNNCFLGGSVRFSNFRFDRKEISVMQNDKLINSNMTRLGGIIGSDVFFGSLCVVLPGRIVGSKSIIEPQVQVINNVPPKTNLKIKQILIKKNLL
tara:strand:- start:45 stop:764 length:720 start_codon:yes stop_codon:yes gene_type:complete